MHRKNRLKCLNLQTKILWHCPFKNSRNVHVFGHCWPQRLGTCFLLQQRAISGAKIWGFDQKDWMKIRSDRAKQNTQTPPHPRGASSSFPRVLLTAIQLHGRWVHGVTHQQHERRRGAREQAGLQQAAKLFTQTNMQLAVRTREKKAWVYNTANEGMVKIQYKCLVPIYVFPEMKVYSLLISKTEL